MPLASTKHPKRERRLSFDNFRDGLTEEVGSTFMTPRELTRCKNLMYVRSRDVDGDPKVTMKVRQGTEKISNTALPGAADVLAETYYLNQSQYIVATDAKVYYLDGSFDPVEIGALDGLPTFTEFNSKLIIHDGGITKSWDGTTFDKLNNLFNDESIGIGDNAETEFTGTVDNPAVEASSISSITFTDGGSTKTIIDNGVGRLTGNVDSSWTSTVSGAVDNGSGLIRITDVGHPFSTSDEVNIAAVVGTTEANSTFANPTWTITKIGVDTYDLQGSTFANAYTSGGTSSLNTIIYSTGAYVFKCDGAPDNATSILIDYEEAEGGPKSKAGFVRADRLYCLNDPDNPERIWYSQGNDEDAWNSTSGGGYIAVDKGDGGTLEGAVNLFQSILLLKSAKINRLDNFPGDTTFRAEPWVDNIGTVAYRTIVYDGNFISFLSPSGWTAFKATEIYGDIFKEIPLSERFRHRALRYANSGAYSAYNQIDNQLWLQLYDSDASAYLSHIYVMNLETGGQISHYEFMFGSTSFNFVNNEMLIGGADGHLYRLFGKDTSVSSRYKDNGVSYASKTTLRGAMTNWELPNNKKHNKKINVNINARVGMTATLNVLRNKNSGSYFSTSFSIYGGDGLIYDHGKDVYIADLTDVYIYSETSDFKLKKRFNYEEVQFELTDIEGVLGAEIYGVDFISAIIGEEQ